MPELMPVNKANDCCQPSDHAENESPKALRSVQETTMTAPSCHTNSNAQGLDDGLTDFGLGRLIKTTGSLCPACLTSIPATVRERHGQVWMDKACDTHGRYSALLASDTGHYYHVPGLQEARAPGACCGPKAQCCAPMAPIDRSEDTDLKVDEQFQQAWSNHSCNLLIEITERCNLTCPTCYAGSSPYHSRMMSEADFSAQLDLLRAGGKAGSDVIQLSGGEPTVHPALFRFLDILVEKGFKQVCINTNGIKLAQREYVQNLVANPELNLSIYLQFDGFSENTHTQLRGRADLLSLKEKALSHLLEAGIKVHPVMTLTRGVNDQELGQFIDLAQKYPQIKDVIIQPAMYSGRYENPRRIDRLTLAETVAMVCDQFGVFTAGDFAPIPCSDPNCFGMAVALRGKKSLIPISRFFPKPQSWQDAANQELISNVADTINAPKAMGDILRWAMEQKEISQALAELDAEEVEYFFDLFAQASAQGESLKLWEHLFMVNIKPFMDAYTYDQDRIDQCCVHILNPQGQPVSFCEYNAIHRPRQEQQRLAALPVG